MTKKDYIKLAAILSEYYYYIPRVMIEDIVKWLKKDSDKFDEEKFFRKIHTQKKRI